MTRCRKCLLYHRGAIKRYEDFDKCPNKWAKRKLIGKLLMPEGPNQRARIKKWHKKRLAKKT